MAEYIKLAAELVSLFIVSSGLLWKLSGMTTRFELIGTQQSAEISELKNAVKELIMQTGRIDRVEERQLAEGKRIDEFASRFNKYVNGGRS